MIAEGSDRNSLMLLCKHGVHPCLHFEGICDSFANACYTRSNENHRKLLYLAHAIGWNDGRLCCRCSHRLIDNFGMWRLYRVYALYRFCCEVRIFSGCTRRGERYAQHYMMFTTSTVEMENPLLTPDNVVSLSHCLTLVQQYLPRAYEESRRKKNIWMFHSRWEMKVYFILYLSIKYLILCIWT